LSAGRERPEISVVVPSHDRPLRLRWLLNALEEQTLDRERFEVVVAHDSSGPETDELLESHPLARAGVLRRLSFPPGGPPSKRRNAGWRAARAPLVLFTDDDCRPPPEWVERALEAAGAHPGAVVQGATAPDPREAAAQRAPRRHSQEIDPPVPWAETCNILYPRELLERLDGFVEDPPVLVADDTDLAVRAQEAGVPYVGEPSMRTYHCVEELSLLSLVRSTARFADVPWLVQRHPGFRREYTLRFFWKRTHALLPLALLGLLAARRRPLLAVLAIPWALDTLPSYGGDARGRLRAVLELPGRLVLDGAELVTLIRGSVRHKTPLL
jgi:glycosyltransferase involved in cell wall biosynthesis